MRRRLVWGSFDLIWPLELNGNSFPKESDASEGTKALLPLMGTARMTNHQGNLAYLIWLKCEHKIMSQGKLFEKESCVRETKLRCE